MFFRGSTTAAAAAALVRRFSSTSTTWRRRRSTSKSKKKIPSPKVPEEEANAISEDLLKIVKNRGPLSVPNLWDHAKEQSRCPQEHTRKRKPQTKDQEELLVTTKSIHMFISHRIGSCSSVQELDHYCCWYRWLGQQDTFEDHVEVDDGKEDASAVLHSCG
ncbi:hypothetical protein QJS04_geneDACA013217 [Acorus gramineus]|uniref:Uncharacterized protein n=1 Tax=Acorus gramineus TaxID=55184 RepID=A0AAV9BEY1_ACOGR|nr:hypothetical protein QJS04_geneDACA013217 [Acorus gramineus]